MSPPWPQEASSSRGAAADRLSSLDQELRLHILTFLPYKSAIVTGALSTSWRDLWMLRWAHPHSNARLPSLRHVASFLNLRPRPRRLDSLQLLLHPQHSAMRRLLRFATVLQLQDLSLDSTAPEVPVLPFPPSLVRLSLSNIRLPSALPSLRLLECLNLHSVTLSDATLARTVSALDLLKSLDLRRCRGLARVKIPGNGLWLQSVVIVECPGVSGVMVYARSLRRLHFVGELCEYWYSMAHCEAVEIEDVYMSCGGKDPMQLTTTWWTALGRPWFLRVLTLCDVSLRYIAKSGVYRNLQRLKEVQLLMARLDKNSLVDICSFFRLCHCPGLEKLFIELPTDANASDTEEDLVDINERTKQTVLRSFDNLKTVKISNFKGHTYEMLLVRILLWKAVNLESMVIVTRQFSTEGSLRTKVAKRRARHPNLLHLLRLELSSMAKSSQGAEVSVKDHDDRRIHPIHYEDYSVV